MARQVRRRYRKVGPYHAQINNDEQLAFLAFTADQRAKFNTAFRDPPADRRAQLLPPQRLDRLLWQSFDLFRRQAEGKQLLAGGFDLDAGIFKRGARAQDSRSR